MIGSRFLLVITLLAFCAMGAGICSASLQEAVDASVDGCIIIMKQGTWYENVIIDNDLTIMGGFGGGQTTINGDTTGDGIGDGTVVTIDHADVILTGLTITNGNEGLFPYGGVVPVTTSGGGIYNNGGTLTLNDVTISGNRARDEGGGIYNNGGTVVMNGGLISGNTAASGGGIDSYYGTVTMNSGSSISGNTAYVYGGGIYNDYSTVTMNGDSSISDNLVLGFGGGIYNLEGTVNMNAGSSISGNSADFHGGGIYNKGGTYHPSYPNILTQVYDNFPDDVYG